MSYGITIRNPITEEVIDLIKPHGIYGDTYCKNETNLYLNVTFNYRPFFQKIFQNDLGIHVLDGLSCHESWDILIDAMDLCCTNYSIANYSENPLEPDWGAVYNVLTNLLRLSLYAPFGVWRVEN